MVRRPDEADRAHPGTGPADVAYGLARPGHDATPLTQLDPDATLLTQLGHDAHARLTRDHLVPAGVRVLTDGSGSPTPAAVTVSRAGAPPPDTRELATALNSPPAPGR